MTQFTFTCDELSERVDGKIAQPIVSLCTFSFNATVPHPDGTSPDVTIGAITEAASWTAAFDAGLIAILPCGNYSLNDPDLDVQEVGCVERTLKKTYTLDVQIIDLPADYSEFSIYCNFNKKLNTGILNFLGYRDCAGQLIMASEKKIDTGVKASGNVRYTPATSIVDGVSSWTGSMTWRVAGNDCELPIDVPGFPA